VKKTIFILGLVVSLFTTINASDTASDIFSYMEELNGEWTLSKTKEQQGSCKFKKEDLENIGVAISFKYIGLDTTIQEDLLPGTARQMVTMYHCKDIACTTLKATHYCVKRNQPEFILNLEKSSDERFVYDCDMSTELCNSDENHVHQIIHELNEDELTIYYNSWKNKKPIKSTVCHFERAE
jgi:hypothetical protein